MKTIIVMPAYNAEATLRKTIADIPVEYVDEIIVVDDASTDKTVALMEEIIAEHKHQTHSNMIFTIVRHDRNKGYGGNQKTCYHLALKKGADIVVMLHPDYQYDPKLVKYFVEFIRDGYFDVMLGSRIRSRKEALDGGMPLYKYYANRMLSLIQNIASGRALSEWHTGMRAYRRNVLESLDYTSFSDDFVFDTQMLFSIVAKGYLVGDIPVPVRYFKEASSINFSRSARYGFLTLWETAKFMIKNMNQVFRYSIAGMLGVITNLGVYALLLYVVHVWYISAAVIAFCAGGCVSFILQKYWTFGTRSSSKIHYQIVIYFILASLNLVINGWILFIFVQKFMLGKFFANVISNAIVAIWSFFIYKYIAFK